MLVEIESLTSYSYSGHVFVEPHTFRLRPRSDSSQRLLQHHLDIEPQPENAWEATDIEGNPVTHAWFVERTDSLHLTAWSLVETTRTNPFDYLLFGDSRLPQTSKGYPQMASIYLARSDLDESVDVVGREVAEAAEGDTLRFLSLLCTRIHESTVKTVRPDGEALAPAETLRTLVGACRDLAVLYVDICRSVHLPARFVSGYTLIPAEETQRELHAWAEVYLPGGGWRGYDPTYGLAVADAHVALAAGSSPAMAAPLAGTFRGRSQATLETSVKLTPR